MKQSVYLFLKQLAKKPPTENTENVANDDFDYGYNIGWQDAEIRLAQEILKMDSEDEDEKAEIIDGPQGV